MSGRIKLSVLCMALVLAACGMPPEGAGGDAVGSTTLPDSSPMTTAVPSPSTTLPAPATTTTTVAQTTTTTTVGTGDEEASALLASLDAENAMTAGRIEGSMEITGLDPDASGLSDGSILFATSFNITGDTSFLMDMTSMVPSQEIDGNDLFPGMTMDSLARMEIRQIGDRVFLRSSFFNALLGAETDWVSMPAETGQEFTSEFETMPTNPGDVLTGFKEAGATVEEVGSETVNEVEATHYRISLDTDEMNLDPGENVAGLEMPVQGVIPVDLWVSEDGYVVRMIMEIDGTGIETTPDQQFDTMTLRYDLFDINGDVVIDEPPASEVTAVEDIEGFDLGIGY